MLIVLFHLLTQCCKLEDELAQMGELATADHRICGSNPDKIE